MSDDNANGSGAGISPPLGASSSCSWKFPSGGSPPPPSPGQPISAACCQTRWRCALTTTCFALVAAAVLVAVSVRPEGSASVSPNTTAIQQVVISLVLHLSCVELTSEPALKEVIRAAASDVYVDRESGDSEACLF